MWPHWEEEQGEIENSQVHVWGLELRLKFKQRAKDVHI